MIRRFLCWIGLHAETAGSHQQVNTELPRLGKAWRFDYTYTCLECENKRVEIGRWHLG